MALNVTNIHPVMRGVSNSNKNTYSNHHTTSVIRGPNPLKDKWIGFKFVV